MPKLGAEIGAYVVPQIDRNPEVANLQLIKALNTCNIRKDVAVKTVENLQATLNPETAK